MLGGFERVPQRTSMSFLAIAIETTKRAATLSGGNTWAIEAAGFFAWDTTTTSPSTLRRLRQPPLDDWLWCDV
jgi:hypothetical protein